MVAQLTPHKFPIPNILHVVEEHKSMKIVLVLMNVF